jgi:hypothetical protein
VVKFAQNAPRQDQTIPIRYGLRFEIIYRNVDKKETQHTYHTIKQLL